MRKQQTADVRPLDVVKFTGSLATTPTRPIICFQTSRQRSQNS